MNPSVSEIRRRQMPDSFNKRLPEPAHGYRGEFQVDFCIYVKTSLSGYSYEMYVTCTFTLMKIESSSCETLYRSTRSEKEANGNLEVEVKSAYEPSGHSCGRRLSWFLLHEATRSISTPPWVGF